MDYSQTPLWMQDDLVKDIPREKLEFLSTLFAVMLSTSDPVLTDGSSSMISELSVLP